MLTQNFSSMMTRRPHIKALLIDVSGNLHVGSKPTPNAIESLKRLRASRIPFRLCSNASKESTAALIARLNALGFDIGTQGGTEDANVGPSSASSSTSSRTRKEVWTSIGSVAQFIRDRGLERPYMLLSKSAREEVMPSPPQRTSSGATSVKEEGDSALPAYDSVVVGLAPGLFDYEHLNTAFRILVGEHDRSATRSSSGPRPAPPPLIATHRAKYIEKASPPGLSLGPGPFVAALENATGCQAHVVGKPTKAFFELVISDFSPSELEGGDGKGGGGKIAVIGDDVEADLGGGAVALGLWRVLVKTGKYRPGDENRWGVVPPDEVFNSFAAFVDELLLGQGTYGPTPHRNGGDVSE